MGIGGKGRWGGGGNSYLFLAKCQRLKCLNLRERKKSHSSFSSDYFLPTYISITKQVSSLISSVISLHIIYGFKYNKLYLFHCRCFIIDLESTILQ